MSLITLEKRIDVIEKRQPIPEVEKNFEWITLEEARKRQEAIWDAETPESIEADERALRKAGLDSLIDCERERREKYNAKKALCSLK